MMCNKKGGDCITRKNIVLCIFILLLLVVNKTDQGISDLFIFLLYTVNNSRERRERQEGEINKSVWNSPARIWVIELCLNENMTVNVSVLQFFFRTLSLFDVDVNELSLNEGCFKLFNGCTFRRTFFSKYINTKISGIVSQEHFRHFLSSYFLRDPLFLILSQTHIHILLVIIINNALHSYILPSNDNANQISYTTSSSSVEEDSDTKILSIYIISRVKRKLRGYYKFCLRREKVDDLSVWVNNNDVYSYVTGFFFYFCYCFSIVC